MHVLHEKILTEGYTRHTGMQTDRSGFWLSDIQEDTQTYRLTDRSTERHTDRHAQSQAGRQARRQRSKKTHRYTSIHVCLCICPSGHIYMHIHCIYIYTYIPVFPCQQAAVYRPVISHLWTHLLSSVVTMTYAKHNIMKKQFDIFWSDSNPYA